MFHDIFHALEVPDLLRTGVILTDPRTSHYDLNSLTNLINELNWKNVRTFEDVARMEKIKCLCNLSRKTSHTKTYTVGTTYKYGPEKVWCKCGRGSHGSVQGLVSEPSELVIMVHFV
jgi:hypothetical protein